LSIGLSRRVQDVRELRRLPNLRYLSFQRGENGIAAQMASEFWEDFETGK
jgi:hypothetical protein